MDGQNNSQNPQQPTAPVAPTPETQAPAMPTPPAPAAPQVPAQPAPAPEAASTPATEPVAPTPAAPADAPAPAMPATPQPEAMPVASVQQAPAPQPATPMPDTLQQAAGVPAVPPKPKKGINIWLAMSFIVLLLAGVGWYYFYLLNKSQPVQEAARLPYPTKSVVSPTVVVSLSPSPAGTTSAGKATPGTVSGTLCYPSSVIPAGTITAKDVTTNKLYTQAYAGSAVAHSASYTFVLPAGTYHLKFTPTSSPTTVGYYTDYSSCVGNPTDPNCSGQKVRPILSATVSATLGADNVNLCDYYYPTSTPPQF